MSSYHDAYKTGDKDFPEVVLCSDHDRNYLTVYAADGEAAYTAFDEDAIALGEDGFWNPRKPWTLIKHFVELGVLQRPSFAD